MSDPGSSPATSGTARRDDVDRLILPALRERLREALRFLAVAQLIYAATLPFSQEPAFEQRAILNLVRIAVLFACVRTLRGEGSRRHTLRVAAMGLGTQFLVGVVISASRHDVLPIILRVMVLTSVSAVFVPWGGTVQFALSIASGLALFVASFLVFQQTGQALGFDLAATIFSGLLITTYIAYFLERSRTTLEQRLEAARRTDEELAALHTRLETRVVERIADLEMANRELEGFSIPSRTTCVRRCARSPGSARCCSTKRQKSSTKRRSTSWPRFARRASAWTD